MKLSEQKEYLKRIMVIADLEESLADDSFDEEIEKKLDEMSEEK